MKYQMNRFAVALTLFLTFGLVAPSAQTTGHDAPLKTLKPARVYLMPTVSLETFHLLDSIVQCLGEEKLTAKQRKQYDSCDVFTDLYWDGCSWYCGGVVDTVRASGCLKPAGKFNYEPMNAHDFNHESVWATDGSGVGQWLEYEFQGKNPRITTVKILNGHVKSEKAWRENSRVKRLKLYYMGKPYAILELEDSRSQQYFDVGVLGPHDENAPSWTLRFEIMDIYPGTKYSDTVIAELNFDGIDVH